MSMMLVTVVYVSKSNFRTGVLGRLCLELLYMKRKICVLSTGKGMRAVSCLILKPRSAYEYNAENLDPFFAYSDTDLWEWVLLTSSSDRAKFPGEPNPLKGLDETWRACRMHNSQIGKRNMTDFGGTNEVSITTCSRQICAISRNAHVFCCKFKCYNAKIKDSFESAMMDAGRSFVWQNNGSIIERYLYGRFWKRFSWERLRRLESKSRAVIASEAFELDDWRRQNQG